MFSKLMFLLNVKQLINESPGCEGFDIFGWLLCEKSHLGNKRNRLVSLFGSLRVQPCANVSGCWLDLVGRGDLNPA